MNWTERAKNQEHDWRVGELCTAVYDSVGEGLIYRVVDVKGKQLRVTPVFGVMASINRRKTRSLGAGWCTPLSLVDLANEYMKFGLFISNEAKHRGAEQEGVSTEIPAGNVSGPASGDPIIDDGGGLCADIAARVDG